MPEATTAKKNKRRQHKRHADSLRPTLDLLSDALLLINRSHQIIFANKAAKRMTALRQSDLLNKKIETVLNLEHPKQSARLHTIEIPAIEPLSFHATVNERELLATFINIHETPGFNRLRPRPAAIALLRDQSDASTASVTPATAYQEILGHLTLRIAHDFNNSLTSILGNAELVQETLEALSTPESNDPQTNAGKAIPVIQDVIRKCLEMATFIKKLQDYARQRPRPKETLDINYTINQLFPIAQKLLGRKITLEFLPSEDLPQLYGERAQMDQILFSLLLNSKETMTEGGRITLRTEPASLNHDYTETHPGSRPGTYIRLTVTDTGIPKNPLPETFELFSSSAQTHEGGLRLPTVYAIVKELGGYIDVESWQGRGSRFEIYLPLQTTQSHPLEPPQQSAGKRTRPGPKGRKSRRKAKNQSPLILIAEDQDDIQRTMERYISKAGYRVTTSNDGNQAFALFEQLASHGDKPTLVISDLGLPGMDGRTLCKKIRAAHPKTALLLTTGHRIDLKDNNTKTLDDDFNFIQKPFESAALLSTIERILENQ